MQYSRGVVRPMAIVMNMFYTGLGIARSLGEQGVAVIGLSSSPGVYGEFTRYAQIRRCPDSRNEPEALLAFMRELGKELAHRAIIFPTRDDDVLFLDANRAELATWFELVIPPAAVVKASLDKWETWQWAQRSGVPAPKCWLIERKDDLQSVLPEIEYPCVLKPIASSHWRKGDNWQKVGGRKAVCVSSARELTREYAAIAQADERVLIQEMISGDDDRLLIFACYMDQASNVAAWFNTRKVLQSPERFGTGVIVQATDCPELLEPTARLLKTIGFTGIAEVEYKWNEATGQYELIEINPRPWDQHRLGNACGVNLMYLAYCEHSGLPMPVMKAKPSRMKWIAEDTFCVTAIRSLLKRDKSVSRLFRSVRGERCYAIWSAHDPFPFFGYLIRRFIPALIAAAVALINNALSRRVLIRQSGMQKGKSSG
jgi:D-aspartate ligase